MLDLNRILGQVLGSPAASGFAGGVAGGVASNLLTSRRGRKLSKKALKYGGLVALGGLAYHAYQKYQQGQPGQAAAAPPPLPASSPAALPPTAEVINAGFLPAEGDAEATASTGLTLVRAMVAAAQADGKLDGDETQAIFGRVEELELAADEKARLFDEMRNPVSVEELAAAATSPQHAAEIYLAALMAIETDTTEERAWLARLAAALKLDRALVEQLEAIEADQA